MNQEASILVVDEHRQTHDYFRQVFDNESLFNVQFADSYDEGIELFKRTHPNLVIADMLFTNHDGIDLMLELKPISSDAVFVIHTETDDDYTEVIALDQGVDDFITKGLSPKVMRKKLQSLLNRQRSRKKSNVVQIKGIEIDRDRYVVIKNKEIINLPKKEFEMLCLLSSQPQKVFSREEIKKAVWGNISNVRSRTIDVHVRKLRKKVGEDLIQTVKGVGYRF